MSTLHVSKFTNGNQTSALVLLHGWGSSSKIWHPLIEELSRDFEIWCIDLPGHGKNQDINWDGTVEHGMNLLADALPPVCSIVGWSLGGLWAQLYMQYFPKRINKLMLIASTPKFVASKNWLNGMPVEKFKQFFENFKKTPRKGLEQFIVLQCLHGQGAKEIIKALSQSSVTKDFHKITWGLKWLEEIDLRAVKFSKLDQIHLLQGENDQVSAVAMAEDTSKIFNKLRLCKIADAGHVPFLSHQDYFIKCVLDLK